MSRLPNAAVPVSSRFAVAADPIDRARGSVLATAAADVLCGVLSAPRHVQWSDRVLADVQCESLAGFQFRRLPCDAEAARIAVRLPAPRLLLAFVTQDTVPAVTRVLRALGDDRPPTLLVARGLPAAAIERLLAEDADDFFGHEFGAEEFVSRAHRLMASATVPPALPVLAAPCAPPHRALAKLIGQSSAFVEQIERIPTIAGSQSAVLILGETGTGKEMCAQAIHYLSARAKGPWIAVNCAALPAELVEAELFGHGRGAFTSAHQSNEGLIAQAEGGTLFLDEVDSLPLASQAKLLRFLQEREYRPLGASAVRVANVRVVAASNADLAARAEQGGFRRDLYFRLAVLTLKLPALRERPADIAALAEHFIAHFARQQGRPAPRLTEAARRGLAAHAWPGNVRELEHCIERAVLFCRHAELDVGDLDLPAAADAAARGDGHGAAPEGGNSFQAAKARVVRAFERQYLEQLLRQHHGNISHAAVAASKNRRAFWELLRRHGIDAECYRPAAAGETRQALS